MQNPTARLLLCLVLAACGDVPEVNAPAVQPGPAPTIAPIDALLASAPPPGDLQPVDPAGLGPRASDLQARAATMRGPVADPATRARLAEIAR